MQKVKQTFVLNVDDFGFLLPGLDDMVRMREHYPEMKFTCFTIPLPKEFYYEDNQKHWEVEKYKKWTEIVNGYNWIQVALHGFSHTHNEMNSGYDKAYMAIEAAENLFNQIGLKFVKLFKAPYWQYSYDAFHALKDKGYVVALDRNNPQPVPKGLETYIYNWSFEEPIPKGSLIRGHGHLYGNQVKNVIGDCYRNLCRIPADAEFGFILG